MEFCLNCKQNVKPIKKFNIGVFILSLITIGGWIFYLIYYIFQKGKCPICGEMNWSVQQTLIN